MLGLPKAVIFDWDNTLVDSWPAIADAINKTRAEFGLPTWDMAGIKKNCTRAARDSFPEWFGPDRWQDAYKYYYQAFDEVRQGAGIVPLHGAYDLLVALHQLEIPRCVVSNKRGDYLRQEVDQVGWGHLFSKIVGAGDALRDKPSREPVDMALAPLGLTPHEGVWFVGDSEADIACARNTGCTPILIGDEVDGRQLGVVHAFSDCKQLKTLLKCT